MAITNLTNTTWKFNETISVDTDISFNITYNTQIDVSGRGTTLDTLTLEDTNGSYGVGIKYALSSYQGGNPYQVYSGNYMPPTETQGWVNQAYRTIEITGGDDVINSDLITFLTANAVQITAPSFTRTKAAIKIYEDLTQEEYNALTKEPHSFYLVNGVGIYKGTTLISAGANSSMDDIVEELNQAIAAKQDTLVSGTNIKTINGESILGEGNIDVAASDDGVDTAYVEDEVLYIDDDTSAASGGVTIIEKTLSGTQEEPTIVESFTEEELDTLISGSGVVRLNMNNVQFVFLIPIFDQQLPEDNVKGVALKGLVNPESFLYIFVNVVKYGEEITTDAYTQSAGGNSSTIINKTISGNAGTETTIEFTEEEVEQILNDPAIMVVGTFENGAETLIFTQQEKFNDSSNNIAYVSLVSYYADNNYYWRLVVGKNQEQLMSSMSIVEISSDGLTEEQVQALIDNAIGTTLQGAF